MFQNHLIFVHSSELFILREEIYMCTSQTESSWGTHVSSEKEDPWVCGPTGSTNPGAASPNTLVMLVTWGTHLVIVYTMWNGFHPFIY